MSQSGSYRIEFIARRMNTSIPNGSRVGHGYVRLVDVSGGELLAGSYPNNGSGSVLDSFLSWRPVPGNVQPEVFRPETDTVIGSVSVSAETFEMISSRINNEMGSGALYNLIIGEHCINYMQRIAADAGVNLFDLVDSNAHTAFGTLAPAGRIFFDRYQRHHDPYWDARKSHPAGDTLYPRCFLAGTPILMADGQEKPIEDIRVGDMVMSFDPAADQGRGALVPKPVSRTFQNITRSIIDLRGLHMTPGHVCLTDDGRFETIAEILLRDGILIEADGTPIRARTGAKLGSMEDTPVLIAYPDEKTGKEIFVRARAGIPCSLVRERDGTKRHLSLALMLRAYHQTLTPDGLIISPDGSLGEATDWPEDSTPMDEDYRRNWVIQTADGKPYVPEWIAAVAEEAREEQTVGATLQRIISPPSQRFTPRVVDNPTPPARNRAERRAQKHRGPK
jgi:hypothetical protein